MKDMVVVGVCVIAFAWLVTVHVSIAFGLARRQPRWHALVGFFVAPLAPWFAWRERMRKRAALWLGAAVVYAVALVLMTSGN